MANGIRIIIGCHIPATPDTHVEALNKTDRDVTKCRTRETPLCAVNLSAFPFIFPFGESESAARTKEICISPCRRREKTENIIYIHTYIARLSPVGLTRLAEGAIDENSSQIVGQIRDCRGNSPERD